MNALDKMDKESIRELLSKGWITHDAMWVLHCVSELGIEKTNKLNRAAVRDMATIEIGRVRKALGMGEMPIDSFSELTSLLQGAMDILKADFMKFRLSVPEENVFHWEMEDGECFAYKGMSRLGCIGEYECGVIYRVETWLDTLQVKHTVNPPVRKCIMHTQGRCAGDITVDFGGRLNE